MVLFLNSFKPIIPTEDGQNNKKYWPLGINYQSYFCFIFMS